MSMDGRRELETILQQSDLLAPILENWADIALPNCWLVAGCIAQTYWNSRFGLPSDHGISDVDLVYFDADDVSAHTEHHHAERIRDRFSDSPVWIDVKNEARVHLWYEAKFGFPIKPYKSVEAAILTFPTTATSVGVRPKAAAQEFHAPYGLDDLLTGRIRPNKALITREIFNAKVARWKSFWPDLEVVGWDED